jgi:Leucine-rich repeat (LRR) protein
MFLDERTTLDLSQRELAEIPEWVWQRSDIETLYLGWNRLHDLPAFVQRLGALTYLYVHDNLVRGNRLTTVPRSLGALPRLQVLDLRSNCVETLPEEIAQLPALDKLDLRWNRWAAVPDWLRPLVDRGVSIYL